MPLPDEISEADLMRLARRVVNAYSRNRSKGGAFDWDEMVQDALVGGWKALRTWREGGARLETYLWGRMTYSVIDGVRDRGHYSRSDLVKIKDGQSRGADVNDVLDAARVVPFSLDQIRDLTDDGTGGVHIEVPDVRATHAMERVERVDLAVRLLGVLNERQLDVIRRNVLEESATLAELGAEFGLTESRVCQIKAAALNRMRRAGPQTANA